jgi:hypothetical protein
MATRASSRPARQPQSSAAGRKAPEPQPPARWGTSPEDDLVVQLKLPAAAHAEIEAVAAYLDMSAGALMRRYIGQGLREDLARYFHEQVLWAVQEALEKRIDSSTAESILQEVRDEFRQPPRRPRARTQVD